MVACLKIRFLLSIIYVVFMDDWRDHFLLKERKAPPYDQPAPLESYPKVAVLIPCFNEGDNAEETITHALKLIILILKSLRLMMAVRIIQVKCWIG